MRTVATLLLAVTTRLDGGVRGQGIMLLGLTSSF